MFELKSLAPQYLDDAQYTANVTLGVGYVNMADLLESPSVNCQLIFKENELCGYATGGLIEADQLREFMFKGRKGFGLPTELAAANSQGKVGYLGSVGVLMKYRGHGGGTCLVRAIEQQLIQQKARYCVVTAWQDIHGDAQIAHLLERLGYERFAALDDFWTEESILEQYDCPTCGAPPCHCKALAYYRPL